MTSYAELMDQAKALMDQAEQLRKAERAQAVAAIKAKMAEYGITAADLGGSGKVRVAAEAKYRGPNGELWSGRGRRPEWANVALANGKSISE